MHFFIFFITFLIINEFYCKLVTQVRQGAENLKQTLGSGMTSKDKLKLHVSGIHINQIDGWCSTRRSVLRVYSVFFHFFTQEEAENMVRESKSRMEYIRMQILRASAAMESEQGSGDRTWNQSINQSITLTYNNKIFCFL